MKKIVLMITLCLTLFAKDIVVFENEYNVLPLEKKVEKIIVGSKEIVNVSVLNENQSSNTLLKLFGKKSGNTSILIFYNDKSIENHHVYVNQNLGYVQKMINVLEPKVFLSRVGDASTVISGEFSDPHQKKRVYSVLENAGVDIKKLMDITRSKKVNKMIRTKLYLVEINNQKAEELGGVTGLGFFNKHTDIKLNANAATGVTFSGFLLDNFGEFSMQTGNSVVGTLNFLQDKGIAKILDDTVLLTTEDKNASFRVGGEVYIPTGIRENGVGFPTIELEEKEYGLSLVLTTYFMEKDNFMHMDIDIKDSAFDNTASHNVQLGEFTTVPSFVSKNIKTDIVAQSGQVIALGGRLHKEEYNQEQKIPLLGDIPLLGELFKRKVSGSKENDLLFFLVPEIVDANKKVLFSKECSVSVASASLKNNLLAVVLGSNELVLIDINDGKEMMHLKQDNVYVLDSRIASPYFLGDLIVFPTLDGKLVIVDEQTKKPIRDVVVSNEKFFGNIIYLQVLGDRLVAATKSKVVSISPKSINFLETDVKDVIVLENRIFVFTKDGRVILADADLKKLKERKFPFATFAGTIYGDFVYMIEKGGYVIATDLDLISTNVYKLPDEIESHVFTTGDALYYKNHFFKLNRKK